MKDSCTMATKCENTVVDISFGWAASVEPSFKEDGTPAISYTMLGAEKGSKPFSGKIRCAKGVTHVRYEFKSDGEILVNYVMPAKISKKASRYAKKREYIVIYVFDSGVEIEPVVDEKDGATIISYKLPKVKAWREVKCGVNVQNLKIRMGLIGTSKVIFNCVDDTPFHEEYLESIVEKIDTSTVIPMKTVVPFIDKYFPDAMMVDEWARGWNPVKPLPSTFVTWSDMTEGDMTEGDMTEDDTTRSNNIRNY